VETSGSFRIIVTWLMAIHLAGLSTGVAEQAAPGEADFERVVARVLKIVPQKPSRVVVIDRDSASPSLRERITEVDGFVTTGESTVYLTKQGSTFQLALRGPGISDYALASIVWHEMAHIAGAGELVAQCREERLWLQFIVERRFDQAQGLRYLSLLRARHRGTKCPP
jgi:hypothetical protein